MLFVGRTRYRLPLEPSLRRKFDALGREIDFRVLASADGDGDGDGAFALVPPLRSRRLDGLAFYLRLPFRATRETRRFQPDAIVAESPHLALAALAGRTAWPQASVVVEVHGDWRASTRLYGSRLRLLLSPLTDRLAAAALHRADRVRVLSRFTADLVRAIGIEPAAAFPAYTDAAEFGNGPPRPLPRLPQALFVGVLERYKNVDGLAEAWRLAAPRLPGVKLRIVGRGHDSAIVERLVADLPDQTEWSPELPAAGVASAMDDSSALILPSRSEGLPRVVLEALARGRPVVGTRSGGIPDVVLQGVNGVLVEPGDPRLLAEALVEVLGDRRLLERLASACRASVAPWLQTPEQFARRFRALIEAVPREELPLSAEHPSWGRLGRAA